MNVGLLDVDGKLANLALMKLARHHRDRGDEVDWYMPLGLYDKVYVSKLFNFSRIPEYVMNNVEIGGTGYDVKKKLPDEIEALEPDYSIYNNLPYSLMLFSRGCIRKCPFCVVNEKEGLIRPIEAPQLNPGGQWIEVLDNNFFANPRWKAAIECLIEIGQPCNFHGIDVRIITEEQAHYLKRLKIGGQNNSTWSKAGNKQKFTNKQIKIAWDRYQDKDKVLAGLKNMLKYLSPHKIMCYVLIGFDSTPEQDMERIQYLDELKIDPFVMAYDRKDPYQHRFQRWVNMKAIFKTVAWSDYK